MTRFLTYTRLRLKTVFRLFPAMLILLLLLGLALGAMLRLRASAGSRDETAGDESARLDIGLVGINTSSYLGTGFSMLKTMDSSRESVQFLEYETREEAVKALQQGDLSAVIEIPDGLVDTLLSGEQGKLGLILPGSDAGIGSLLIRELSDVLSSIIQEMESSASTLVDFSEEHGVEDADALDAVQTDLLINSLTDVLHRSNLFEVSYVEGSKTLPLESYYLISAILLLILLSGILCAGSFIRSREGLCRLLKLRGLGPFSQVSAEFLSLGVMLSALFGLVLVPVAFVLERVPVSFTVFTQGGLSFHMGFLQFAWKILPVILLAASMDLFLYETSTSLISGIPVQFLVMMALAYISGLFYPVSSLPPVLRRLSAFLPTGQALLYLQDAASGGAPLGLHLLCLAAFVLLFLLLSALLRRRRLTEYGGA